MTLKDRSGDRRLLGVIAIGALVVLAGIVVGVFVVGKDLSKEAYGLLGVIVGGVLSQPSAVISAIKESWLGHQNERLGAALHASNPSPPQAGLENIEGERELPEPTFGGAS